MENVEIGLMLMGIGMTTVFVILLLVIYIGKSLIALVNTYAPEEVRSKKPMLVPTIGEPIAGATLAAIVSAIGITSRGKGQVVKIEKV